MKNYLLVINTGSSSIKFAVYHAISPSQIVETITGLVDRIGLNPQLRITGTDHALLADRSLNNAKYTNHKDCLNLICTWLLDHTRDSKILAVGHRVVHGGVNYIQPTVVDENIFADLERLIPLAPLHQPHNLLAIRAFMEIMPDLPQVACFDTAFHATQPELAQQFGLPRRFFEDGVRRYGFHGLSCEAVVSMLPGCLPNFADARLILAHLGNGCSLSAIHRGTSIATTMGFSPLDGLLMGTRCGNLDPGVLLFLMDRHKLDSQAIQHLLYHESGLLGVSGISSDMRTLLASSEPQARQAVALFVYRIKREIGSLTAALGGLDALIFTGGIGENSPEIRALVCHETAWLGIKLDQDANNRHAEHISAADSKIDLKIVAANENLMIARHTLALSNPKQR